MAGVESPQAISLDKAEEIAGQVHELVQAGNGHSAETSAAECARLRRHYNLTQLPVVEGNRLIGVILPEFLLSATVEHDTRQMHLVASIAGETVDGSLPNSIRTRLPWLTVNIGTTFLAAATVSLFESTLTQVVVLAAFLPVVAG